MTDPVRDLALALLLLVASAQAETLTQNELSALLAATPRSVDFSETRYSFLLEEPMTIEGQMSFEPPNRLIRSIRSPSQRVMTLTDELAIVSQPGGRERRVNIESRPALQIYGQALRGLLAGDLESLEAEFALTVEGEASRWRLRLVPRALETRRLLEEVDVSGEQSRITQIVVRESADEWSRIELSGR
jgi:outer membrane lipoprotein-sorting protein